jgi:hypothetical protein
MPCRTISLAARSCAWTRCIVALCLLGTALACAPGHADRPAAGEASRERVMAKGDTSSSESRAFTNLMVGKLPSLPWVRRGFCPFECCRLGTWTTDDSVDVYATERDTTSRSFRLPPGASIVADTGNLHTVAWGIVVLQESADIHRHIESALDRLPFFPDSSIVLSRGDTVWHAGHVPEAGLILVIHGRGYLGGEFWRSPEDIRSYPDEAHQPGLLVQPLREEWWVHIRSGDRNGWIDAYHSKVNGSDACG